MYLTKKESGITYNISKNSRLINLHNVKIEILYKHLVENDYKYITVLMGGFSMDVCSYSIADCLKHIKGLTGKSKTVSVHINTDTQNIILHAEDIIN